jgi:hypothetical protein
MYTFIRDIIQSLAVQKLSYYFLSIDRYHLLFDITTFIISYLRTYHRYCNMWLYINDNF